jgi:hypothetical protein
LHERQPIAAGERERRRIQVGEALGERGSQLATRPGPLADELPGERERRLEVEPDERRREVTVPLELAVEHGLGERPEDEAVVGGEEVDRAPHRGDAHKVSMEEETAELVWLEAVEPRPEPEVGVQRDLRLEADEMGDSVDDVHGRSLE